MREALIEAVVREGENELNSLPEENRAGVVKSIIRKLSVKSDDELISMVSRGQKETDPNLVEKIQNLSGMLEAPAVKAAMEKGTFTVKDDFPDLSRAKTDLDLQTLGVDIKRELPSGSIELGFGDDPVKALSNTLTKHFKKPVIAFQRGEDILYVDPTDKVIVKANPNIFGKAGQALPLAGDIAGTIGGGAIGATTTKLPAGVVAFEAAGAGIGTTLGEYARLYTGKALGVHDLSQEEMIKKSGAKGGEAAVATLTVGGLQTFAKSLKNFLKGHSLTKEQALKHGMTSKEADAVIDEVNRIGGKDTVKGTLGLKTGNVVVRAKEAEVRDNIRHAQDFIDRDLADQAGLTKALDIVTKPSKVKGGEAVQDVVGEQVTKRVGQAKQALSDTTQKFHKKVSLLGKTFKEEVGEPTRKALVEETAKAQDNLAKTWDSVKKAGGYNEATETFGITVLPGKAITRLSQISKRRTKEAITNVTQRPFFKKGSPDLADYNRELSDLRSELRAARKGKSFGNYQTKDLDDAIKALEADRRLSLTTSGEVKLLNEIEEAELKTAQFHSKFNRSLVGKLTQKDETGVFKIKSESFVDDILKGDAEEARQLLDVIGDQPSLMNKWKEGISNSYKRDVIDKIKPFKVGAKLANETRKEMVSKTKDWIGKHKKILDEFFSKEELAEISRTGDLAVLVKKQVAQHDQIIKDASKKFGAGKLTSLDSNNVVKFVTGKGGSFASPLGRGIESPISKIRYVKSKLRSHPEAWNRFKTEYSSSLRKAVVDPDTKEINPKALSKWLNDQTDELTEVFGEQYVKDLRSINKVSFLLKDKPKSLGGDEVRSGIIQALRGTFFPPLTKEGRLFTAATIFETKAAHDVISRALLDPTTMGQVAKLAEHKKITREVAELAVSLGLITE